MQLKTFITSLLFILSCLLTINGFGQTDQDQIYKFNQVIDNINNSYVDSIDINVIIETAIKASLKELDPHCLYYPKEKVEEINRGLVGSYTGIGITYDIIDDTVMVLLISPNGPSEIAGLKSGDKIIRVNDEVIAGMGITDEKLKDLLQGERGTHVNVTIKRRNTKRTKTFDIVRSAIPVNSIDAAYSIDDVAYIKLSRFSSTTIEEFKKATDTLISKKTDKLILDLRNNSGGYLYVSVKLLEFFLERNTEVLTTKGYHSPEKKYYTQISGKYPNIRLIVLINEHSASASEIFAGAVQDWDRAVVMGRRSFGKGLVQKPIYLIDGSMLRLTIAKYYTPTGRNIQKPYAEGLDEYRDEVDNRYVTGELMHKDSVKYNDSLKYYTLNNKRIIYGGGGIMPDIFIPVDTLKFPYYIRNSVHRGKLNEFIHIYVDNHRDEFELTYPFFSIFNSDFNFTLEMTEQLAKYVFPENEQQVYIDEIIRNGYLLNYLKAMVANDLYGEQEYYMVFNKLDDVVLKAIDVINDEKEFSYILQNNIVGEFEQKIKTPE